LKSFKWQLTAGRDSTLQHNFQINTQLVESYLHFYSGCRFFYRKTFGRINFSCRNNTTGFSNQHSPLTMFRKVEGCRFGFQLPCKGTCSKYIHSNLQETDFELSVARLNSRTHSIRVLHSSRVVAFPLVANHRNISFSLDAFFGLSFVC